ncbi:MAG: hypothetical protein KAI99_18410 [Cyclobacteriaceae bacterium]|nr:hypothetical protein [Cyclobacteriaceae bacterium]
MKAWSNIQISPQDPEIVKINKMENRLGELPDKVNKIRELITRFEVCHFKYQQHLKKIKDSIITLESNVDTNKIGINHIQYGDSVLNKDTTGKSLIGQQYVWAIKEWLNDSQPNEISDKYDKKLGQEIHKWLGDRNPDKIRLVRLLQARLTWDWKSYEKLQHGGELKDIEFQASRMDICHYAFPKNLDLLLKGIGQMKAVEEKRFEGCGSYNTEIKEYLEKEFLSLNNTLKSFQVNNGLNKNDLIKTWLAACLAKTIKENINISVPITDIEN